MKHPIFGAAVATLVTISAHAAIDFDRIKSQTETVTKALVRVQPMVEALANGQIDTLQATLASDAWKNIIKDFQTYLESVKKDLPTIVESIPAAQAVKGKLGLLDSASEELNGLLVPTKIETVSKAVKNLQEEAGYKALQPQLAAYYKNSLTPMFKILKEPKTMEHLGKVLNYVKEKEAGKKPGVVMLIPSFLGVYNLANSILGVLAGASEFCLVVNQKINNENLQLPDSVVATLKIILNRSYEVREAMVEQINTILATLPVKITKLPVPEKPVWVESALKATEKTESSSTATAG